jgi:glycerol-3-phosphate dehydrogenase
MDADIVINAAGLWTDSVETLAGFPPRTVRPCRGEYFVVTGPKARKISGLVYPVPHPDTAGLGVHLTKTMGDDLLIGPNVRWIESKTDYEGGREPLDRFLESARRLLPDLEPEDLQEAYCGIRPKLTGPGEPAADFEIAEFMTDRGLFITLRGIESPGLTAAPAIAREVTARVARWCEISRP